MLLKLNIGMHVAGKESPLCNPAKAIRSLVAFFEPTLIDTRMRVASSGEPTMVATIITPDQDIESIKELIGCVCRQLKQDCIAFKTDEGGQYLVGPNIEPYGGQFNPAYFLEH